MLWKGFGFHGVFKYQAIHNKELIPTIINNGGLVVFGIKIDNNFKVLNKTNTYWNNNSNGSLGYHAMVIVGYKKMFDKDYYVVRNSWGEQWGDSGYCYMSKEMFDRSLFNGGGFDCWTLG
jgi:C1A family cysteine protease